jgi:hypothetical protein
MQRPTTAAESTESTHSAPLSAMLADAAAALAARSVADRDSGGEDSAGADTEGAVRCLSSCCFRVDPADDEAIIPAAPRMEFDMPNL